MTGGQATSTGTAAKPKIEFRNVSLRFGDLQVLKDINLVVTEGEFVSLVGPSGCGKTTLLRITDGLAEADGGEVIIDGRPISGPGPDRAFVFQQDGLFPWRTAFANAAFGLELRGKLTPEQVRRVKETLELVGLKDFENYLPRQLSGGMRQRVNLARALCTDPEVLLMDEPFAALDAQTRELMQDELLRIWEHTRKTVLFVTHQIDEAVYLSDRVVILGGRPAGIQEIVEVTLPRPRPHSVKRTPEFGEYVDHIWSYLHASYRGAAENA